MEESPPGMHSMEESEMEMHPDMMHPDMMHPDMMHPDMHPDMHSDMLPDMHPGMMHPDMHPDMMHPNMMHSDMMHPDMMHPDMVHPDMMHPDMMAPDVSIPPPPGMEALAPPGTDEDDIVPTPPGTGGLPSLLSLQVEAPSDEQDMRLPQALEQALAFKNQRAQQVEDEEEFQPPVLEERSSSPPQIVSRYQEDEEDDEDEENLERNHNSITEETEEKESPPAVPSVERGNKNKRKKKKRKHNKAVARQVKDQREQNQAEEPQNKDVQVEYVQETISASDLDPIYRQFAGIFEKFKIVEPMPDVVKQEEEPQQPQPELKKVPKLLDEYEDDEEEEEKRKDEEKKKLSKRKLKKLTRLSVAELKQLVNRPDVVEMHDVTARDPKLLVQLKAYRNTVPVPRHWCFKRKYLQGKRGIEKPPFNLPEFIKKTGIMEMRSALQEKEDQRTLKAKMRERARPKLGKIDIDYQKLHDAFFKWQTKPRMTIHGDLYYEGKEFETRLKEKKPGDLSDELRTALGMPVGSNAYKVPPPWLIAMQRYGPPPSYPNLKIPGLNAPIPDGCSFGYHAGGWGKPPVDETGKALYGDVFGTQNKDLQAEEIEEEVDRTMWGELESESEEESEEEEEESEEGEPEDKTGLVTPAEGLVTPSGITSIPTGLETPEIIELRKRKIESDMEGGETPALYQVLPEKRMDRVGNAMMASTHIYDMTGTSAPPPGIGITQPRGRGAPGSEGTVELALDPSELDLVDTDAMAARYEQQLREQQSHLQKEDLSDMLADHVARQKSKRKRQQTQQDSKQAKKYKEFKF